MQYELDAPADAVNATYREIRFVLEEISAELPGDDEEEDEDDEDDDEVVEAEIVDTERRVAAVR